jgi:hypothetical protein
MDPKQTDTTFERERMDEFFAIINMIGYAKSIANDLGVPDAASDLQSASQKLAQELQSKIHSEIPNKDILKFSDNQGGNC